MVDYKKRLSEVDEILNHLAKDDLLKIPEDIRQLIKNNKDKEYIWEYDKSKKLEEQNLNRDTIVMLSYLNMEYLLNEEQKKLMQQIHELNEKKLKLSEEEKHGVETVFKTSEKQVSKEIELEKEKSLEKQEQSFLKRLINKIKLLLKR